MFVDVKHTITHSKHTHSHTQVRLDVHGMKCGGCAGRVRQLLEEELGVLKATVSLPAAMAVVSLDHKHANASSLLQKLKTKGFAASIAASSARGVPAHEQRQAHKAKECRALLSAVQVSMRASNSGTKISKYLTLTTKISKYLTLGTKYLR